MIFGILLAAGSGLCMGLCFLPMRYMKAFAWENTWFVWVLFSCLLFPPLIAYLTIPSLAAVYQETGARLNLIMLAVGLVAGTSGIFFGLGLARIGMALANSLSNGVSLAIGSFIPLIVQHPEVLNEYVGMVLIAGLGLSIGGVCFCAWAGSQSEHESEYMDSSNLPQLRRRAVLNGIILSIAAGLLTPLLNLGLAFAGEFADAAKRQGASQAFMSFALYVPYLGTSFVSNGIYCAVLWKKNGSYRQFKDRRGLVFTAMAVGMAAIWIVGNILYGWAMPWMQSYGPILGWPISLASTTVAATVAEYLYGDWKGKALRILFFGVLMLMGSIALLAYCGLLLPELMTS
jgi:L-rhamnose-H+ transport protein